MAVTKANMAILAAEKMNVKGDGETIDSNLDTDLQAAYDQLWAWLDRQQLVDWASDASVPDEFVDVITDMMAVTRLTAWPVPSETKQLLIAKVGVSNEVGLERIVKIRATHNTNQIIPGNYF